MVGGPSIASMVSSNMIVLVSYLLIIVLVVVLFYASYLLYKKTANSLKVDLRESNSDQFTSSQVIDPRGQSRFSN